MPIVSCKDGYYVFRAGIQFPTAGLFWYHFEIKNDAYTVLLNKTPLFDAEPLGYLNSSYCQNVYKKESRVSPDYRSGAMYHIFVDRFCRGAGDTKPASAGGVMRKDWGGDMTKNTHDFVKINREFFGGNLYGVIEKLPYIADLGVKTIYLSPIFQSSSYHRYDTRDFARVDEMLGGDVALRDLIAGAKKHGIGIILDGVFNHIGKDSEIFKSACASKTSPYYDWFEFTHYPDKYSCWWGIDTLPQFNEACAAMQKYIAGDGGIVQKYMKMGIAGFRLDVVDEITDPFLDNICARIKAENPSAVIIGEVWEDAAVKVAYDKRRHYFAGGQLDGVMNYPLKNAVIDFVTNGNAEGLASVFYTLRDHYPVAVQNNLMNFLGTHDTKRILSVLGGAGKNGGKGDGAVAFNLLKIASAVQYMAVGVPSIFYGDEAGIGQNGYGVGDAPFSRVCMPWEHENRDTIAWYKKLGILRKKKMFDGGDCNVIFCGTGVFVFERVYKNERAVFAGNCGRDDFQINLKNPMRDFETDEIINDNIILPPNTFKIFIA
jgi:glycosidase